jgi:hypothetical protein
MRHAESADSDQAGPALRTTDPPALGGARLRWSVILWLYVLNAAVLITHEIDSAYWNEWELFRLPGGVQLFLVANLLLVVVILCGLLALARGSRASLAFSWMLAGGGLLAVILHSYFLAAGEPSFRQPVSLALLAATFVLSAAQAVATWRAPRPR